jgi:hypothetical protein
MYKLRNIADVQYLYVCLERFRSHDSCFWAVESSQALDGAATVALQM